MLDKLIKAALKGRVLVLALSLLIALVGAYIAKEMSIDVLPDLNRPTVVIMTEAHAMVPEDVEQLVTTPIEQILNGATGVERVTSNSGLGLSVIKVEFAWGSDIYLNRQIVAEKIPLAKALLPDGIEPIMAPISSVMGQTQIVGLSSVSGKLSIQEIRALADYQLKYDLLAIPGVAKVLVNGGAPKQLQVIMDTDKLRSFNVSVVEVEAAVKRANLNSSGGFINLGTRAPAITVTGLLKDKGDLENAVVLPDALRPVRIKDIAEVRFGPAAIKTGEAGVNGEPGVMMVLMKQPGYDTVKLTQRVDATLKRLQSSLDEDLKINPDLFKQSDFINRAIDNVIEAVRDGGIMVVVILLLFLMNWRTTFITLTAIPMSIAITAIIFAAFGISINTMTLGGLAVAIGALVDDAIVDVENVYRRLNENRLKGDDKIHPMKVIYLASCEVRKPIVIGTLLVMVVYTPLFFLTGMEGKLFAPIGIAYIISVAASLLVSLTLTPALCYMLLPNNLNKSEHGETFVVRKLKAFSGTVISFSISHAKLVIWALVLSVGAGLYALLNCGSTFLPPFNEGVIQVNLTLPPDTGLDTSTAYGLRLEKMLTQIEGVQHISRRTGRTEGDEHAMGVNTSEVIVSFDPKSAREPEDIKAEIRQRFKEEFPGIIMGLDQPMSHLLSAMLSGVKAQVAVKIYGPDLNRLRDLAQKVELALQEVDSVTDLMIEPQVLVPNVAIEPNREQLARYGLSVEKLGEVVELSLGGEAVSRMVQGRYVYPIVLRLKEVNRNSLEEIGDLTIRKDDGSLVRVRDVATVHQTLTSSNIKHENVGRRIVVQHNIAGRSLGEVVSDVDKALSPIRQEILEFKDYSIHISGQFEAQEKATRRILWLSLLSLLSMLLILYMHFKSINLCFQVLASIPMAFVGAAVYVVLSGQVMSVATLVGLISLGGIASRNAILLIDHYLHLMKVDGMRFGRELIIKAGQERIVPVMMTALTSGIALIPLALAPGQPGKEVLYPVATVIIGGLISATLLDFIVAPSIFHIFGGKAATKAVVFNSDKNAVDG